MITELASGITESQLMIRKKTLSLAVLFVFILAPALIPPALISAAMVLTISLLCVFSGFRIQKKVLFLTAPMIVFMIIGLIGLYQNALYNVFKDFWYTANPVLALITGYILMRRIKDLSSLFRIVILASVAISLFHILKFVINPSLLFEPVDILREKAGSGYFLTVLAIPIIVACRKNEIELFRGSTWITKSILALCLFSLVLSFSRTFWISLVLMLLQIYGVLSIKNLKKILLLCVIIISFLVFMFLIPPSEQTGPDATLRGKAAYSFKEIVIRNYVAKKDIAQNWRGYESFRAIKTYLEGSGTQYITGRGFGTLVDLGFHIKLGGEKEFRYIPILHNGYMYILVKTGLVGLFIYLYFFIRIISQGRKYERTSFTDVRLAGNLIVALSIVILATTFVIAGFFNKSTLLPAIMLLGALLGFTDQDTKRSAITGGS